ncbi:MAG: hypothetical protein AAFZ58_04180 [Pseudomonadota bacterium]
MSYLLPLCLLNAALLVAVAAVLFATSRETNRRETVLASRLETLHALLNGTAQAYDAELCQLSRVAERLRRKDKRQPSESRTALPAEQVSRLATTAKSASELAELTGLGRAEATLMMNIRSAKARLESADNEPAAI